MSLGSDSQLRVGIGAPPSVFATTRAKLEEQGSGVQLVRFKNAHDLVEALERERIDAAVRGTVGSGEAIMALRTTFGLGSVMRTAILEDDKANSFLLTPVGIDEGSDLSSKMEIVRHTVDYFGGLGWKLKIGVLSKGRLEDVDRGIGIRKSVEEGELIAKKLRAKGLAARHFAILIEDAIRWSDLIVAPDGVTGNLIFRSLHFVGGCKAYGAPVVNLDRVFVDTSRAKADFSDSVLVASGLARALGPRQALD